VQAARLHILAVQAGRLHYEKRMRRGDRADRAFAASPGHLVAWA